MQKKKTCFFLRYMIMIINLVELFYLGNDLSKIKLMNICIYC